MRKQDGFPGQLSYVVPEKILNMVKDNPMISDLYTTDIGYYPHAGHHFRERTKGIEQFILIYNTQGLGVIKTEKSSFELAPDHFFIIPAGVPHAYYADSGNPWSIYWIHFAGNKAGQISKPLLQPVFIERSKTSRINDRIGLFSEIFQNLERGFSIETLEYVNLCLPRLLASFTYLERYRMVNEQIAKDPVDLSINFMLENLSCKFRLSELAHVVNLSASHYSRLFLSRTGHSPINYFIQLKIQHSCKLFDSTNLSVVEVAREAGFDDQFYFSRQFRKVMGMSPREFRRR